MDERELRRIFDQDPLLYDRARPGYPAELFDDLATIASIGPGDRVLEVGPGTGQATAVVAGRGAQVVAVELGAALASVLAGKLPSVDVVVAAFEDWRRPGQPFDTLVAFTAWHWLDPAVRTTRAAASLRSGGTLATVTTTHVKGGTEAFFADVQECYERWDPSTPPDLRQIPAAGIPPAVDEVDRSELFGPAERRRYEQDVVYTTQTYLEVLGTYSGHRAMPPEPRRALLAGIGELIDTRYGGTITKRYLYELRTAPHTPS